MTLTIELFNLLIQSYLSLSNRYQFTCRIVSVLVQSKSKQSFSFTCRYLSKKYSASCLLQTSIYLAYVKETDEKTIN